MKIPSVKFALALLAVGSVNSFATIITYSDRTVFNAAAGPVTVEDFTPDFHFPIPSGILNAASSIVVSAGPPITPGLIKPGVTYSTPVGSSVFFNIDAGGGYVGGFLDSINDGLPNRALTVGFDSPNGAFGFDANSLMGNFSVAISFSSGPDYVATYSPGALSFYGFQSSASDITTVKIHGDNGTFAFALDNFTFNGSHGSTPVSDFGNTLMLFSSGVLALFAARGRNVASPLPSK